MKSRYRESRIAQLPPIERVRRVKARLHRRVYHRLFGDYAGGGHDIFDVLHFATDLGFSLSTMYELGFVKDSEDYGWKLPHAPDSATWEHILEHLINSEAPHD